MSNAGQLFTFRATDDPSRASLRVRAGDRSPHVVPRHLTGKFCEHLGSNIYNGMLAQIVRNSTFAEFPFGGGIHPDGGLKFLSDEEEMAKRIRARAARLGWPEEDAGRLLESRADGLAHWWVRLGGRQSVRVSPDAGPHGGRAQRVEVSAAGEGLAQWMYLPLHRVRRYEWRVVARSSSETRLRLALAAQDQERPAATSKPVGLSREWRMFSGELELDGSAPVEALWRLSLTAAGPGQFVVARVLLEPADHVAGADSDVVRLLADSHLPILRWPGGNFVSGYRWEDGIGPVDARPTRPNPAWGGVEPNFLGTDEFLAFCRAVGCEPMICVNAGDGTPEEAARWVEYCNGPPDSPQGSRRAAGGHPEPYNVRYWEVGNELWGRWQVGWTTPAGYADRYGLFAEAMLEADPAIRLVACGHSVLWGEEWNGRLLRENAGLVRSVADHFLLGQPVPASTDPMDVYRDYMAIPVVYEKKSAELGRAMRDAGVKDGRIAVTELQIFAGAAKPEAGEEVRLTRENLVTPATLAEALHDVLIYHMSVRLAPLVEMITHSATVNHGGGLRKERERVYANPCHHAQAMFAALGGARPVAVEVSSPVERAPAVVPQMKGLGLEKEDCGAIDAVAAIAEDGALLVSLVHRGTSGPVRLTIETEGFEAGGEAQVRTLSAQAPWAANSIESPDAVAPADSTVPVLDGGLTVELPPFSVTRVRVPGR